MSDLYVIMTSYKIRTSKEKQTKLQACTQIA